MGETGPGGCVGGVAGRAGRQPVRRLVAGRPERRRPYEEMPLDERRFRGHTVGRSRTAAGRYDWEMFDATFARYARAGLHIQFMIWVGPDSPRWIYEAGVPEVKTTPTLNPRGKPHGWTYPFYLDANYKRFYHRMIDAVARHVDTLPTDVREKDHLHPDRRGNYTGDEGGYKGDPLDQRYVLPEEKWNAFKFETWKLFEELYRDKKPPIHLLTNSGNSGPVRRMAASEHAALVAQGGQSRPRLPVEQREEHAGLFRPADQSSRIGTLIRARSEMDEMFKGWFQEAPVWNLYWLNLWGLHFGLDIFQHGTEAFKEPAPRGVHFLQPLRWARRTRPPAPVPFARCTTVWTRPT